MKSRHLAILVVVSFLAVVSATLVVTSLVLSLAIVDDERLALLEHEPIHRGQRGNSVLDAGERDEGLPAHPALLGAHECGRWLAATAQKLDGVGEGGGWGKGTCKSLNSR